jgi:hypothetical protein
MPPLFSAAAETQSTFSQHHPDGQPGGEYGIMASVLREKVLLLQAAGIEVRPSLLLEYFGLQSTGQTQPESGWAT